MLKLTRITDGNEYLYTNKEEFINDKLHRHQTLDKDPNRFVDMFAEIHDLVNFIQKNDVIGRLDRLIARYY